MDSQITAEDLKKIEAGIREKYIKVAKSPEGQFQYTTGNKGITRNGFPGFVKKSRL